MATKTITIDASDARSGVDFANYLTNYYGGLSRLDYDFYGAAPVTFGGSQFYVKGSQIGFRSAVDGEQRQILLEGANLAYDFIAYNSGGKPGPGHGFSGTANKLTFGYYNNDTTPQDVNVGDNIMTNVVADLVVTGLDMTVSAGGGNSLSNPLYTLVSHLYLNGSAGGQKLSKDAVISSIYASLATYNQNFIGSSNADKYRGTVNDDIITMNGGADQVYASAGQDVIDGGDQEDRVIFAGTKASYTVEESTTTPNTYVISQGSNKTTVSSVELLRFSDIEMNLVAGTERVLPLVDLGLSATSLQENSVAGTVVGTITANPEIASGLTFKLKNAGDGKFALEGGNIVLKGSVDYEMGRSHTILLSAVDEFGFETEQSVTINIGDVNEKPTDISLSSTTVREGAEAGTRIAYLSGLDPENTALSFSLASNPGNSFQIVGNQLQVAKTLDYDKVQARTIVVEAKDTGGATFQKSFKIDVIDVAKAKAGTGGNDVLKGAIGIDVMRGGAGNDKLSGLGGNDKLYGGSGNDVLDGGSGNDLLKGDAGTDKITGGAGADKLYGGAGSDAFIFKSIAHSTVDAGGRDTILDFSLRQGDKIDLKGIDANTLVKGNQAFKFIAKQDFHKKAGELRYEKAGGFTYVEGDVNGDGNADFSIALKGGLNLSKGYFVL